jgi:DNA-binding IclR family transcriptional regulator
MARSADGEYEGGLKSVTSAIELLDCFVTDEELGVSQVARRLGVAKSTAHRLLTTLAAGGLIEQNPANGRYRLGLRLFELGHLALSRFELRRESRALLEELREVSGLTVHLAVAQGADTLYLERLPTLRGMQAMDEYRRRWPLNATSSGKVICAYDPVAAQARIDAGFPVFTPNTIATADAFRAELAMVRKRGYATASEEVMLRLASVAAPVMDNQGFAQAAVSITGSVQDLSANPDRLGRLVQAAAHRLSKMMQHLHRSSEADSF